MPPCSDWPFYAPHLPTSLAVWLKEFNQAIKTNNVHFVFALLHQRRREEEGLNDGENVDKKNKSDESEQADAKTKHKSAPRKQWKRKKGAGGEGHQSMVDILQVAEKERKKKKVCTLVFCMCVCACHEVCLEFDSTSSTEVGWPWEEHCQCTLPTVSGSTPQLTFNFNPSAMQVQSVLAAREASFSLSYRSACKTKTNQISTFDKN